MSNVHGKNTYFQFEDSSAASRNLSADGNRVSMTESVNNPDITGFGDNSMQRAGSGLNDAKVQYEGWYNDGNAANVDVFRNMRGKIGLMRWGPSGSATGASMYAASMILDDVQIDSPLQNLVTIRASFSLASGSMSASVF